MILQLVGLFVVVAVIAVGANWILNNVRFGDEDKSQQDDNKPE